jgi:hypothetical protein
MCNNIRHFWHIQAQVYLSNEMWAAWTFLNGKNEESNLTCSSIYDTFDTSKPKYQSSETRVMDFLKRKKERVHMQYVIVDQYCACPRLRYNVPTRK